LLGWQWYDLLVSNLKTPELDGPKPFKAGDLRRAVRRMLLGE
jgi:hypothetical protein